MTLPSKLVPCVLALLVACGGDDDSTGDGDTTGADSSSTSGTTMVFPTTDPDSSSSGVDPTLATVTDSETASSTTDPTTDPESSSGSDTSAANVCDPAERDSECYACQKENCCDAMTMCVEADPNCACVLDCMGSLDDPGPTEADMCASDCNADYLTIVPSLMMLAICEADMCGGNNGCGGGN